MKPSLCLLASLALASLALGAEPRRKAAEPIEHLPPFNVREQVFPSIDVHFELAGIHLADPLGDPILEAKITSVDDDGLGARLGLRVGDTLTQCNGIDIRGLTLRQLAAVVAKVRNAKGTLVWEARHGITPFTVRYNVRWDTPLPGQTR